MKFDAGKFLWMVAGVALANVILGLVDNATGGALSKVGATG